MDAVTGYEFTETQNEQLLHLYRRMQFLAYILVLAGSMVVVAGSTMGANLLFSEVPKMLAVSAWVLAGGGFLLVLMGLMLIHAVKAFRAIVETSGSDINHLMEALVDLTKFFTFSAGLGLVAILGTIGITAAMVFGSPSL